jgi:predicted transcriptional regulator
MSLLKEADNGRLSSGIAPFGDATVFLHCFGWGDTIEHYSLIVIYQFKAMAGSMKYRSRTDIVSQMLEAANGGSTKTKIMYAAYLSYAQLKEYLTVLVENGLMEHVPAEQKYRTTEKGIKFLRTYSQIGLMISPNA